MSRISEQQLDRISNLVREVEKLSDVEKLLLYLQLPCGRAETTEGKYRSNGNKHGADIFSKRPDQETTQTYTWILSHLEEDQNVSLPKQEVYDEYQAYCQANQFEPLCVADFGKAMKHALPCIKPRRLGQRGNSRYCYSGLRKKYRIEPPSLPDMFELTPAHRQSLAYQNDSGSDLESAARSRTVYERAGSSYDHCATVSMSTVPSSASSTSSTSSSCSASSVAANSRQLIRQVNNQNVANLKQEPTCNVLDNCPAASQQHQEQPPSCCRQEGASRSANNTDRGMMTGGAPPVVTPIYGSTNHNGQQQQQHHDQRIVRRPVVNPGLSIATHHHHQQQPQQQQHHPQQQQQHHQHQVITSARFDHQPASYQDCQLRSGTPDDDDYRHNYHDLNRPMVGPAIIPFSQSLPAQLAQQPASHESFLSYNTIPYSSAAIVEGPYQQSQPHHHQHHHNNNNHSSSSNNNNNQQVQMRPHSQQAKVVAAVAPLSDNLTNHQETIPDCCSDERMKQNKNLDGTPATIRQPFEQICGNSNNNSNPNVQHARSPDVDPQPNGLKKPI